MKVAVIGAGPYGRELAKRFDQLGAYVCLFDGGERQTTKQALANFPTEVRQARVLQVQKRFLGPGDQIEGHSRLQDLFRLSYAVVPGDEAMERMSENAQVFEKLGPEVLESLKKEVEAFIDVDLVIDARGPFQLPLSMGPGGAWALNERTLGTHERVFYGRDALAAASDLSVLKDVKTITIVGTHPLAMHALQELDPWLQQDGHELNLISAESECFERAYDSDDGSMREMTKNFIKKYLSEWKQECEVKRQELQRWRALADYERAKVPMPVMPEPKLKIYEDYVVTSVDKLLDREGLFLTVEIAPWHNADQNKAPIRTVTQQAVLVLTGFEQEHQVANRLRSGGADEPGYYNVQDLMALHRLVGVDELFAHVEEDLSQYFSKA